LDYPTPVSLARAAMGPGQILLGNIDPVRALRNASASEVRSSIGQCHRQAGPRYIVGAGCEVPRDTPLGNLRALIDYARETQP
jgi:uroporphyrinogen-III decarboxylase